MEHLSQFIINHWGLCLAFVVILVVTLLNELVSQKKKAVALAPQAVVDKMNYEDAVLLDLRDKAAYNQGHIIDSISITTQDDDLAKVKKYQNKPIILICAKGISSQAFATKLQAQGLKPFVLEGGIEAWQNADLPLVK